MNVTLPESLKGFVEEQVRSGRYKDADAFVAELVRTEADLCNRIARGDSIPVDEHFARRIASLLDEAEQSGDYVDVSADDFDAMEREAQQLAHNRK